jgi:hypothetical protein
MPDECPRRTTGITVRRGRARGRGGQLYVDGVAVFSQRLEPDTLYHLALVARDQDATFTARARLTGPWSGLLLGQPGPLRRLRNRIRKALSR